MTPFIRAAEVWLPSQDKAALHFGAGLFSDAPGFAAASGAMTFGRGEGLPGDAWSRGRPILLKQLKGTQFMRTSEAHEAGLTCAVALPFFVAGELSAILVLYGSNDGASTGAVELWRNDPRVSSDMTLTDGYYGGVPAVFEAVSRDTYLPRGAGLPGMAWQREEFIVMAELSESTRFLRGDLANDAGIRRGLALPCTTRGHASYVLSLLSGGDTPVVRRAERWVVDPGAQSFQLVGGYCEVEGPLGNDLSTDGAPMPTLDFGGVNDGLRANLLVGKPALMSDLTEASGHLGAAARACDADSAVCIPILVDDKTSEVAVLYL